VEVCWAQLVSSANEAARVKTRHLEIVFSVIWAGSLLAIDPTAFMSPTRQIFHGQVVDY
jgi:hypothetical protein